jgi:hypothetical protein
MDSHFCQRVAIEKDGKMVVRNEGIIDLRFKNTLTVIEINSGDQVNYELENGSNSDATKYSMECMLEIDVHEMTLVRYVPKQPQ